ncbi:MAG: AAA family ATPase, partial [Hyphomonadaceae bacterium]
TQAQSEYAAKSARLRNMNEQMRANRGIDTIAEAQNSAAIGNLRSAQTALSARKADVTRRYDVRHPEYQKVMAEEADNARQIDAELQRIASSLEQEVLISRERVSSLQGSLNRAKGELAQNNRAGVEQAALERDAQATRTLFDEFNNRFKETGELEGITDADAVIDSYAPTPGAPSFPNTKLNLILGFMLGLALAGFAGLVMELLDNYMSSPEEVEQVAGVPFIGQIPLLSPAGNFTKAKVKPAEYLIDKPHSGFAEAYRHLRASVMFADIDKAAKTVAIVSSLPSEGKTSMTFCLGRMAAMSGTKTIVIDGDIRLRQLTEVSGVKAEAGLLEYLFGEARLADAVQTDEQTGLHILPLTDRKHTPRDVFGSRAFDALLNMLQQTYDLIIIDTGPILLMAETRVVMSKVDQVVVATRWRKTHRGTLRETMKILRDFHANVAGVVLTFVDLRKRGHHSYTSANYKAYAKYYHDK